MPTALELTPDQLRRYREAVRHVPPISLLSSAERSERGNYSGR